MGWWVLVIIAWSIDGSAYTEKPGYWFYNAPGEWLTSSMHCEEVRLQLQARPSFPTNVEFYCEPGRYYPAEEPPDPGLTDTQR